MAPVRLLTVTAVLTALLGVTAGASDAAAVKRLVVFKRPRTGSTWMSEILNNEAHTEWFIHEAHDGCKPPKLRSLLAAPPCLASRKQKQVVQYCYNGFAQTWEKPSGEYYTPACLSGKLVGIDVHEGRSGMKWAQWAEVLRQPDMYPVVYIRTNLVKYAVAKLHSEVLGHICHSIKTYMNPKCVEQHRAELNKPMHVNPGELRNMAYGLGAEFVGMLKTAGGAAGRPPFALIYEGLQLDPAAEVQRLHRHVGLNVSKDELVIKYRSVDSTQDNMRDAIENFDEVKGAFKGDPCLLAQLVEEKATVYWELCRPGGSTVAIPH